jgi:hypothetical protein
MESIEIAEFIWIVNFFENIWYFLYDLYRSYLGLFFEPWVLNYGSKHIGTIVYFMFSQSILLFMWIYYVFIDYIFHFLDNWVSIDLFWKEILIEYYHLLIWAFLFLYIFNILAFFAWKYFWRKKEKVKSSKVNFYIIFFQFFPIIWFLGNFIAGKNYEISLWKMLLKNLLFLLVLILWFVLYAVWAHFISNGFFIPIYDFFYLIISPVVIWLWAYFYYFKIKKSC